jgi:hypothetical protein
MFLKIYCILSQRAAWIPYFIEITALIFLAPLSSFNERLAEDNHVNCLEDTFVLWRVLSANKILANVQLVGISVSSVSFFFLPQRNPRFFS